MEQEIITTAVDNFSALTNMTTKVKEAESVDLNYSSGEINFLKSEASFRLPYIVKKRITAADIPFLQEYAGRQVVFVCEYLAKPIKKQLRESGINYLEISGNTYINDAHNFIFIDSQKRVKLNSDSAGAAFSKSGLKIIYQLLINDEAVKMNYRDLGSAARVSIDTVSRVYKELVREKYLVRLNKRDLQVLDYKRLFNDWVTIFNKTLRPKLRKRNFSFKRQKNLQQLLQLENFRATIGGELAAEELSEYLIAEKVNIYLHDSFAKFAFDLNLIPDKNGSITLIEQFWKSDVEDTSFDKPEIAPMPLVYADLISDPKPRNFETAKIIYEKYAPKYL